MYKVQKDEQGLRLVDRHAHPVAWWRYSHPARMLLLGTGDLGIWLQVPSQEPLLTAAACRSRDSEPGYGLPGGRRECA